MGYFEQLGPDRPIDSIHSKLEGLLLPDYDFSFWFYLNPNHDGLNPPITSGQQVIPDWWIKPFTFSSSLWKITSGSAIFPLLASCCPANWVLVDQKKTWFSPYVPLPMSCAKVHRSIAFVTKGFRALLYNGGDATSSSSSFGFLMRDLHKGHFISELRACCSSMSVKYLHRLSEYLSGDLQAVHLMSRLPSLRISAVVSCLLWSKNLAMRSSTSLRCFRNTCQRSEF